METEIIIALILTILILLFSRIRQAGAFRKKEAKLNATAIRLKSELGDLESLFDLKIKQHRRILRKAQTALSQQKETPPIYNEPPPELFHENAYWKALSTWYRREQDWICEECGIELKMRTQFLHVHHVHGRSYNAPEYLMALCVGCHADQPEHEFMKNEQEYRDFVKWRGNALRT